MDYHAQRNAAYWSTRPVEVSKRALAIGVAIARWLIQTRLSRRGGDWSRLTPLQAQRLRETLTDLGPAFVKIGQAVSSRPDVTPPDYLQELEKLQDQIPPFDDAMAMKVIQEEMGRPPSHFFTSLTPSPVAAASLGQVYKGVLRSNGKTVAVKVQRPAVRERIALDIYILRRLAGWFGEARKVNSDLPGLLDEWAGSLFRELDYKREARNGMRFQRLYGKLEGVYVPHSYVDLTTQRVLVMEWVEGQRLRSGAAMGAGGGSREDLKLVEIGVRCSLEQMLEQGFYHSDPHPGNLFKAPGGKLAYIDFGMVGSVDAPIRLGLIQATLHLVNREFDALADDFVVLGLLPAGADRATIAPALIGVFQQALAGGVSNMSFGDLSGNLGRTMYQYGFKIPSYYTLLIRSLSVLEGIALSADKNYKVLGAAYPWIARRLLTDKSDELRLTLRTLLYKDGRFQFARLESLLQQAVRSPSRSSIQSSDRLRAVTGSSAAELLLGPEGTYIREIIVDELAKGIDAALRTTYDDAVLSTRRRLMQLLGDGALKTAATCAAAYLQVAGMDAEVAAGRYRGLPGSLLLEGLMGLPALADQDDRTQIEGINRLIGVMQETVSAGNAQLAADGAAPPSAHAAAQSPSAAARASLAARNGQVTTVRDRSPAGLAQQQQQARLRQQGQALPQQEQPQAAAGSGPLAQITQAAQLLQWLGQEAGALPPAARWEALRIPLALAAKVSSRVTARALRGALTGQRRPAARPASAFTRAGVRPASAPALSREDAGISTNAPGPAMASTRPDKATEPAGPPPAAPVSPDAARQDDPFIKDTFELMESMQAAEEAAMAREGADASSSSAPVASDGIAPVQAPAAALQPPGNGQAVPPFMGKDLSMVALAPGQTAPEAAPALDKAAAEERQLERERVLASR